MQEQKQQLQKIQSPALVRLVAIELHSQARALGLSEAMQDELKRVTESESDALPILKQLNVYVDLRPLLVLSTLRDGLERRRWALRLCIARQAHMPLLKLLFPDITSKEATSVRKAMVAEGMVIKMPPKYRVDVSPREMVRMCGVWNEINASYSNPVDRWVLLADRFPGYAMVTLYRVLVTEASWV